MKILETVDINKSYEKKQVLDKLNMHLKKKEIVCILGASGVGKTTLFNIIAGLDKPDSGRILINGQDVTNKFGNISYMMQKDLLLPYRTVIDNVALPLIIGGEKKAAARAAVNEYFETFDLQGTQNQYPNELSGGMRQRAELLRTYMFNKEIMLLDEPFSALDTITKRKMHSWFLSIIKKINISIIFITHDIDEAIKLADRIYLLSGSPGKIIDEISLDPIKKDCFDDNYEFELSSEFIGYKKKILSKLI